MFKVIQKRNSTIKFRSAKKNPWMHGREIFLFCMLLTGLIFGAFAVRTSENIILDRMRTLLQNYIGVKAQQSVWINFSNTCLKRIVMLLGVYCTGTCAFGAPLLYAVPAIYGAGIGMVSAYLYAEYALKGIGYCALLWYPGEVLFLAALLLACSVSVAMTGQIVQSLSASADPEEHILKKYTEQFGILLLLTIASAVPETALYTVFSGYFQFS